MFQVMTFLARNCEPLTRKLTLALQAHIEAIGARAGEIVNHATRALNQDHNGSLQPAVGEGARQCMQQPNLEV